MGFFDRKKCSKNEQFRRRYGDLLVRHAEHLDLLVFMRDNETTFLTRPFQVQKFVSRRAIVTTEKAVTNSCLKYSRRDKLVGAETEQKSTKQNRKFRHQVFLSAANSQETRYWRFFFSFTGARKRSRFADKRFCTLSKTEITVFFKALLISSDRQTQFWKQKI